MAFIHKQSHQVNWRLLEFVNKILWRFPLNLLLVMIETKGECNLNQSKDDSFVERVAKNNSWNNGDRHRIHEIFPINCFVFVITLVWNGNDSNWSSFNGKNIATNCSQVTVSVLALWTKKPYGHYATLELFPLRSLSLTLITLLFKNPL